MDFKESEKHLIFKGLIGSHLYGTAGPDSDIDRRGVFVAPFNPYYIGFDKVESCENPEEGKDEINFEFRHFVNLCLKGSPGQIELLFNPTVTDDGSEEWMLWTNLYKIRNMFISKKLYYTLGGFAQSDMKKILGEQTRNCGVKGKLLMEKFGYNTKHAANAYRLSKTLSSLLLTGEYNPVLHPAVAADVKSIKDGKLSKEDFLRCMNVLNEANKELLEEADLPESIPMNTIKNACSKYLYNYFRETGEL